MKNDKNPQTVADDFLEIHDTEIDTRAIMHQIRAEIEELRRQGRLQERQFPTFGVATMPAEPEGEHDVDLYYHLKRANDAATDIGVTVSLAESPFTNIPVLGKVWRLIRRQMHELIVYYVSILSRKQVQVNTHLVSSLNRLTAENATQKEEIEKLRQEIAELHQRVEHT